MSATILYWSPCGKGEPPGQVLRSKGIVPRLRITPNDPPKTFSLLRPTVINPGDPVVWVAINTRLASYREARYAALVWLHEQGWYAYSHAARTIVVEIHPTPIDFSQPGPHHNHIPKR